MVNPRLSDLGFYCCEECCMFVLEQLLRLSPEGLRICSLLTYGFCWVLIVAVDYYITTKISLDGENLVVVW